MNLNNIKKCSKCHHTTWSNPCPNCGFDCWGGGLQEKKIVPIKYSKFPTDWMIDQNRINLIYAVNIFFEGEKVLTEWVCFTFDQIGSPELAIEKTKENTGGDYTFSAYKINEKDWSRYRNTVEHY